MPHPLAPHVHLAVVDADVVLLDAAADRYLCVPDGRSHLRPSRDRASVSPRARQTLEALEAAGMLSPAGSLRRAPLPGRAALPPKPRRDLVDAAAGKPTARDLLRLGGALFDLAWRYRGRSFGDIVGFAAAEDAALDEAGDRAEALRLAALFRDALPWLPASRKCLVRSFLLLRFLHRSGVRARWVFGVRTWPFSAHCWIQLDEVALDDSAERLAAYQPILAVG